MSETFKYTITYFKDGEQTGLKIEFGGLFGVILYGGSIEDFCTRISDAGREGAAIPGVGGEPFHPEKFGTFEANGEAPVLDETDAAP